MKVNAIYKIILWRDNSFDELNVYQLNTVTYGTASAPYLSIRCLRQVAIEQCTNDSDKDVLNCILNDFFVDDLITGHDDLNVFSRLCKRISDVCQSGCFP